MVSTYTPNRGYELQGTGDNLNTWGAVLNSNVVSPIDKNMGGTYNFSTTGGTTSLSSTEAQNLMYNASGTLASNATVQFPNLSGFFFVKNGTSGAYTLTVTGVNGGSSLLFQGETGIILVAAGVVTRINPSMDVTGDIKASISPSSATWLLCNGTSYGAAGSGATQRANNDTYALYVMQWGLGATPVGGRGASADADWAALKPMPTLDYRGRVLAGRDSMGTTAAGRLTTSTISGSGPDSVLGTGGAQDVNLTSAQNGPHTHNLAIDGVGDHQHGQGYTQITGGSSGGSFTVGNQTLTGGAGAHTHSGTAQSSGSGAAHLNVQPTTMTNFLIKL